MTIDRYRRAFPDRERNKEIFQYFLDNIPWEVYPFTTKRRAYRYETGNEEMDALVLTIACEAMRYVQNERQNLGYALSGIFFNLYRDGNDYTPYHKDSYGATVITVSYGRSRDFYMKNDVTKEVTQWKLRSGDIFVFDEEDNDIHKHSIPQRKRISSSRISLVFFCHEIK